MADRRRALLVAALGFALLEHQTDELDVLHAWLDSWRGIGLIVVGMARHGYDLSLTSDENGWRATFLHRSHVNAAVGRPSAQVVADALARCPGGRVARAAHAVCGGLLAHGGDAAVERQRTTVLRTAWSASGSRRTYSCPAVLK